MKPSLLEKLACPRCFGPLQLRKEKTPQGDGEAELIHEGKLRCAACAIDFPIHFGVASLAILDHHWTPCLNEMIARRLIRQETWEADPAHARRRKAIEKQVETHYDMTDRMTDSILETIDFSANPSILDVGAGELGTSRMLAERGADVVALDPELANLYRFDMRGYSHLIPQEELTAPSGDTIYRKSPDFFDGYFARVFASGHRLPFADGVFDITFCRSMAHHLDDIPPVLTEMLRVTRPGGRLILCSEPIRSIFEGESWLLECDLDAHRGMNEHRPRFLQYWRPLARRTRDMRVQYSAWPMSNNTLRLMRLLRYNYQKHLRDMQWLSGWRIGKVLPLDATINLTAERNERSAHPPKADEICEPYVSVDALVEIYSPARSLHEIQQKLSEETEQLVLLRRRLLSSSPRLLSSLDLGKPSRQGLTRGFGEPLDVEGRRMRPTLRTACATLRREPGETLLGVFLAPVRPDLFHKVRISVNEKPLGVMEIGKPVEKWLDLSEVEGDVLDVVLENDQVSPVRIVNQDIEVGVGVGWIVTGAGL